MYLFLVYLHVGFVGPTNSSSHFINGYSIKKLINQIAKFCVTNP
jgi:hypothetical protein